MTPLFDDMISEELFNPGEYTEKELLKLVYRELHTLRGEFDEYRKNNTTQKELSEQAKRITELETTIAIHKELQKEDDKRQQRNTAYIAIALTAFTLILKFFVK